MNTGMVCLIQLPPHHEAIHFAGKVIASIKPTASTFSCLLLSFFHVKKRLFLSIILLTRHISFHFHIQTKHSCDPVSLWSRYCPRGYRRLLDCVATWVHSCNACSNTSRATRNSAMRARAQEKRTLWRRTNAHELASSEGTNVCKRE